MATTITAQPKNGYVVSTLLPIYYKVTDTSLDTTNIIAKCMVMDQTTAVQTQVGGAYRLAPSLTTAGTYRFDASEAFNTLTKYTLNDCPNNLKLGAASGCTQSNKHWTDVATFFVNVNFYREYLDATTGLIVVDPTAVSSHWIYIHEGCPNKDFLVNAVADNGINRSPFYYFNAAYSATAATMKRWLTNYPIKPNVADRESYVDIHESESYSLYFFAPRTSLTASCPYYVQIYTYDDDNVLLGSHSVTLTDDSNMQSIWVGFRDIVEDGSFTATVAEGTNYINVTNYKVELTANTSLVACSNINNMTRYWFRVKRNCLKNGGYLRFAFKNMLGGYDMVSSNGKFTKKTKNKFEDFEQTLGYFDWNEPMEFGNSNWANQNVERYTVTTELKKPELAAHFAEMLSSTDVYVRAENISNQDVVDADLALEAIEQPYNYYPIVIKAGNTNIQASQDNLVSLKFSFEMAVNQRNPRY